MDKFYFFKVTLIYYDDVTETLFITPDQTDADEEGIPFSEQELRENAEFKAFVKKNKVDVVDVKYVEYAVDKDNKTVILGTDITKESFKTLENHDELEIIEENEFPLILKQTKKASGGSKMHYICLAAAAIVVLMFLFANAPKMGKMQEEDSSSSEISEEISSDESEATSYDESSSSSAEISSSSSTSTSSSSSSSDTSSSESADSSSSETESSEDENSSSSTETIVSTSTSVSSSSSSTDSSEEV